MGILPKLFENTVDSNDKLELVLVDGGSTDGTLEYIKQINHPRIKLIEIGHRSSYPHFMNIGIQNSSYEIICQWNDDVILVNQWDEVIEEISNDYDFYLFNWKYGSYDDINDEKWLHGTDTNSGWCLCNGANTGGEIVMNYGLYRKKIFREIGMYSPQYQYYYADGDMSYRAYQFGYKVKDLNHIKVCSLPVAKVAVSIAQDNLTYQNNLSLYRQQILPESLQYL